eukprot:CAMPEP_0178451178 /NCGR_PEP_ID=MMETSP0689_2-20121128/43535_1 /TAXON_ID=160604 /ORGANISM="Amphidinium massartii, Strain CS-259" /LENGTH=104 /DNA_ID=CAMNT_0020076725 /DNA_START=525 /DNA_END=839 /DNA_ORIENTATION=-
MMDAAVEPLERMIQLPAGCDGTFLSIETALSPKSCHSHASTSTILAHGMRDTEVITRALALTFSATRSSSPILVCMELSCSSIWVDMASPAVPCSDFEAVVLRM